MNNKTLSNIIAIIAIVVLTILGIKILFALSNLVFKLISIIIMIGIVILILKFLTDKKKN